MATQELLAAMLEHPDDEYYGLELAARAGLKSGTIYPALARLEEWGWVSSAWERGGAPGRPRRRYYRLTGHGRREAEAALRATVSKLRGALRPSTSEAP